MMVHLQQYKQPVHLQQYKQPVTSVSRAEHVQLLPGSVTLAFDPVPEATTLWGSHI